jgi:c(7)-type cytochrome triheme protein
MPTSSKQKGKKRSERSVRLLIAACGILLVAYNASAQIYLPKPPPQPEEYGRVIINSVSGAGPGAVVFDHWLHRSKFTCRVCHVDVGFAMEANATGISASTNRQGFHCGACHDGKKQFDGKTLFTACAETGSGTQCDYCHSLGKKVARQYEYKKFTARLPKGVYGVNWEAAEKSGAIKLVDFVEGISVKKAHMQSRKDFLIDSPIPWVEPIEFSHEKHSIWNGCELCHPEIFPTAQKGTIRFSMFSNIEGQYCGACHGKVAFPLNHCQGCHPGAPFWAP